MIRVDKIHARSGDFHERLPLARLGLGLIAKLQHFRAAGLLDVYGFHKVLSFLRICTNPA